VALPVPDADLTTEPLQTLAPREQRLVDIYGGFPPTESPALTATLEDEPLSPLPMTGQPLPALPHVIPPIGSPALTTTLPSEDSETLALTGKYRDVPMSVAATGILQTTLRIAERVYKYSIR
jgi:hypothetical protein